MSACKPLLFSHVRAPGNARWTTCAYAYTGEEYCHPIYLLSAAPASRSQGGGRRGNPRLWRCQQVLSNLCVRVEESRELPIAVFRACDASALCSSQGALTSLCTWWSTLVRIGEDAYQLRVVDSRRKGRRHASFFPFFFLLLEHIHVVYIPEALWTTIGSSR